MLNVNPDFRIYEPPLLIFGGIEIHPPYQRSNLSKEMAQVLKEFGDSLYQAYEIHTRVDIPNNNIVLTRVSPLTATIDEKCRDYSIERNKLAKILLQYLKLQGKNTGLITHENGFYVIHILKEKFDLAMTEYLIKTIKTAILVLTYNKFRITSNISDDVLRINAEIISPNILYIV